MSEHSYGWPEPTKTIFCKAKSEERRFETHSFYGDCLERIGIPASGGKVKIDRLREVKVGDIVHCTKYAGTQSSYLKRVIDIGETVLVGTCYLDQSRDFSFKAAEIFGVAISATNKEGVEVWNAQIEALPEVQ